MKHLDLQHLELVLFAHLRLKKIKREKGITSTLQVSRNLTCFLEDINITTNSNPHKEKKAKANLYTYLNLPKYTSL